MTIAAVGGQAGGNAANSATSVTRAFGSNVTAGSLITITALKFTSSTDAFVLGDCTQSAGTATLVAGSMQMDSQVTIADGDGSFASAAQYSAIVATTGSCTMQIAGAVAGSFILIATNEYTGTWDSNRVESINSASNTANGTTSANAGNVNSVGAALFLGGFQLQATAGTTITENGAYTLIFEDSSASDDNGSAIYRIVTGATIDAPSWTMGATNNGWSAVAVAYREAASTLPAPIPDVDWSQQRQWKSQRADLSLAAEVSVDEINIVVASGGALVGATTITFSATGVLAGSGALSGAATLTFSPTATIQGFAPISGAATITFSPSATIAGIGALSGATTLTFSPSSTLTGTGALVGGTTLTFAPSATLTGSGALTGSATVTFTASGTLTDAGGGGNLTGSTTFTFTVVGVLSGTGDLAGSTTLTFSPSGVLTNGSAPVQEPFVGGGMGPSTRYIKPKKARKRKETPQESTQTEPIVVPVIKQPEPIVVRLDTNALKADVDALKAAIKDANAADQEAIEALILLLSL